MESLWQGLQGVARLLEVGGGGPEATLPGVLQGTSQPCQPLAQSMGVAFRGGDGLPGEPGRGELSLLVGHQTGAEQRR